MGSLPLRPATKTTQRCSLAGRPHNRELRLAAKQALKYPPVAVTDQQVAAVAEGFKRYFERSKVPMWACAIMPDHVHLVVGRPPYRVEQLVIQIKGNATQALLQAGIHPLASWQDEKSRIPKCFARGEWKVFLDPQDVPPTIRYVEQNPIKEGREPQHWPFVETFR